MGPGWVTMLLLAFGIAVGVIGVIAYLRLFRKEKRSAANALRTDAPPSAASSGESNRLSPEDEPESNTSQQRHNI